MRLSMQQGVLDKLTDEEIIVGLFSRNEEIVEYFFYDKCSKIFAFIIKEVFSYQVDKDELVSELYIYLQENNWNKVRKFNHQSKFTTWLSVVAVRFFIKKRMELIDSDPGKTQIDEIKNLSNKERFDIFIDKMDLYAAINKLPNTRERFVIMATEIEGWNESEIADILDMKVANVYNIKSRGKNHLSNIIKENSNVN